MDRTVYPLVYGEERQQFARSVVVGDLVFLSGSSGRTMETGDVDSDEVRDQMIVALDKIRVALLEAGTSMESMVKTVIYLKRAEDYAVMRQTEREYWREHAPKLLEEPPASTFVHRVATNAACATLRPKLTSYCPGPKSVVVTAPLEFSRVPFPLTVANRTPMSWFVRPKSAT